jgi:hypothetical protein
VDANAPALAAFFAAFEPRHAPQASGLNISHPIATQDRRMTSVSHARCIEGSGTLAQRFHSLLVAQWGDPSGSFKRS